MAGRAGLTTFDRFFEKVAKQPDGCWTWLATPDRDGYGLFKLDNRQQRAHRVSYRTFIGPIPDGLEVDHLCRNRRCVNPEHLEAVTVAENRRRSYPFLTRGQDRMPAHCKHGHEFTPENTWNHRGSRYCRACMQAEKEVSSSYGWR